MSPSPSLVLCLPESAAACRMLVEFLYSGTIQGLTLAHGEELAALSRLAQLSDDLSFLADYVNNVRGSLDDLNPSIGTFLNDRTAERMKERLLGGDAPYHDVALTHGESGEVVRLHRAVVGARCDVLASRIAQGRLGVEAELAIFRMLVDYIYTEHVLQMDALAGEEGAAVLLRLLAAAARMGLPRLVNLCELYLSKAVERATAQSIQHCRLDLAGLLQTAGDAYANQLVDFVLHWLCTNYEAVSKRPDVMARLSERHRAHLEAHQWPPREYIAQVERYEEELERWSARQASGSDANNNEKCIIQ